MSPHLRNFLRGRLSRNSEDVETQAANWLARCEQGLDASEQSEFERWQRADPRHSAALQEMRSAWNFMQDTLRSGQGASVLTKIEGRVRTRARARMKMAAGWAFGGLAAAAALFLTVRPYFSRPTPGGIPALVEVRPEFLMLPDGSRVDLNAGAEIAVDFSAHHRSVNLVRGEAYFAVAKDRTRPFIVSAGSVKIRAVGTEFSVQLDPTEVGVLVTEGEVAVQPGPADAPAAEASPQTPWLVGTGRQLRLPADGSRPAGAVASLEITAPEITRALAWRSQRLEFTNTPLQEVVDLFNQQNRLQLRLRNPATGALRISGVFWTNDSQGFSRLLEASTGLRPVRAEHDLIVLTEDSRD